MVATGFCFQAGNEDGSSSCHVFMVEPTSSEHERITRARVFNIVPTYNQQGAIYVNIDSYNRPLIINSPVDLDIIAVLKILISFRGSFYDHLAFLFFSPVTVLCAYGSFYDIIILAYLLYKYNHRKDLWPCRCHIFYGYFPKYINETKHFKFKMATGDTW